MIIARRAGIALFLTGFALGYVASFAQTAPYRERTYERPVQQPVDWNKTRVTFTVHGKPWAEVLRWFGEETRMPFSSRMRPPEGNVTFYSASVPNTRAYSLNETFDILNEMLMAEHGFVLLRGEKNLMIWPVDGKDWPPIPRVSVAELSDRAKTEIVEVTITLKGHLDAEEFAPKAKRLLGPFASVTPIRETNQLIIVADVASLRRNLAPLCQ
jgi:hypothetical protein